MAAFFPGFSPLRIETAGVSFHAWVGGTGAPVLLLHGYPQTHLAWRHIAPCLAQRYRVVVPDLPGYGASRVLRATPRLSKRHVATALVALMSQLGHERFAVVGHDRGARAGYRMALDHPQRVAQFASLTVVPTLEVWNAADWAFGHANFHWYLLAQPFDLPERLLAAAPDAFIDTTLARMAGGLDGFEPRVLDAYRQAFRDPAVRHAMCEDYRSAAAEDREHDLADRAAGNTLACPVLVTWPASHSGESPLAIWRRWAGDVRGAALSGGHLQPEFSHQGVLAQLLPFLVSGPRR